jgi:predicted nucleic acid-binding protein
MILIDTSVWIDFLNFRDPQVRAVVDDQRAMMHPLCLGEIAIGGLRNRRAVLDLLEALPDPLVARDEEVRRIIERHRLHGIGLSYIDAHLVAAALLTPGLRLWSRDVRLHAVARRLGLAIDIETDVRH